MKNNSHEHNDYRNTWTQVLKCSFLDVFTWEKVACHCFQKTNINLHISVTIKKHNLCLYIYNCATWQILMFPTAIFYWISSKPSRLGFPKLFITFSVNISGGLKPKLLVNWRKVYVLQKKKIASEKSSCFTVLSLFIKWLWPNLCFISSFCHHLQLSLSFNIPYFYYVLSGLNMASLHYVFICVLHSVFCFFFYWGFTFKLNLVALFRSFITLLWIVLQILDPFRNKWSPFKIVWCNTHANVCCTYTVSLNQCEAYGGGCKMLNVNVKEWGSQL